jgi:hypothetical protein
MLVDECVKSVSYRYPSDDPTKDELPGPCDAYYLKPYCFEDPKYRPTAAELYQAVRCYGYQSCEHPEWKESDAHKLCEHLQRVIHRKVPAANRMRISADKGDWEASRLWPELEATPWGFEWDTIALAYAAAEPNTGSPLLRALIADPKEETCHKAFIDWIYEAGLIPDSEMVVNGHPLALWPTPDYVLQRMAPVLAV